MSLHLPSFSSIHIITSCSDLKYSRKIAPNTIWKLFLCNLCIFYCYHVICATGIYRWKTGPSSPLVLFYVLYFEILLEHYFENSYTWKAKSSLGNSLNVNYVFIIKWSVNSTALPTGDIYRDSDNYFTYKDKNVEGWLLART